jgi:predicted N-acetyltransferase YhbS
VGTALELVEMGNISEHDWNGLIDGEHQPWGAEGAALQWREKDRYVGLRAADGRLLAVAGTVVVGVEVGGHAFPVVGLGGLIVTRSERGAGLMSRLVGPLLALAAQLGPERGMLFCRPELVAVYERLQFHLIADPVWADGPRGRIEMPMSAMWRTLHGPAQWPAGVVEVEGTPF